MKEQQQRKTPFSGIPIETNLEIHAYNYFIDKIKMKTKKCNNTANRTNLINQSIIRAIKAASSMESLRPYKRWLYRK